MFKPLSWSPPLSRRAWLLTAGSAALPVTTTAAAPAPLRPLAFPADFGAHPATRIEWWYITGTLEAAGAPLGFQITFFRARTRVADDHPSRFAARQLVFAHTALTDLTARRLQHDQRVARAGFGIAQAAEGDTDVSLRGWRLLRSGPAAQSRYQAQVRAERFGFDLAFAATQPLLLQGVAGWSQKGPLPAQASRYYSQPQLAVSGTLTQAGRRQPVRGSAWLDHEWSDSLLAPEAVGWDWIGINLDDGSALTAFQLRRADGSTLWAGGSWRGPGQAARNFNAAEVRFTARRVWQSPASQARYPVVWTIETPAGRHTVAALLDDQELDSRASTGSIYWEGLSELRNAQGQRIGRGYLEMTGYAGALRL